MAQELQLNITGTESKEESSIETELTIHPMIDSKRKDLAWWINMAMYTFFVLGGQSAGMLLGRLYFAKRGKSIWLSTVLQIIGFPAFIPLYYILPGLSSQGSNYHYRRNKPKPMNLAIVYITLGLFVTANSILYSIGLQDLPVSTYSLICASQLAFNAIFAFFLNSQKFTPCILNSIVLLTVTSTLLIFQNNSSDPSGVSNGKYAIGFVCTVVASAGFSLMLSLTQFAFESVLKTHSFVAILDVCIYQQLIATCFTIIGVFSSGQWRTLKSHNRMDRNPSPKSYHITNKMDRIKTRFAYSRGKHWYCIGQQSEMRGEDGVGSPSVSSIAGGV